jgi:exosortase
VRFQPAPRAAAITGLAFGLCGLILWLYGATLKGLGIEWMSSSDASYGLILAVIAAATIWTRRDQIAAAATAPTGVAAGLSLLTLGLCTFLIGRFGADVFVTRVSFVLVLAGVIWTVGGTRTARLVAAPVVLLLIAIPLPALIVNAITLPMQLVASRMAEWLLATAHIPVFRDGNVLELQSTSLEVAEACSGLRSLISLTAIGCLIAWATERSLSRRIAVIAAAVPIAVALNAMRIAATGAACELWSPAAATGGWHTFTGWVTFVFAVILLIRVQRLMHLDRRRTFTLEEAASA